MKEFILSHAQAETAILVAIITPQQDERKTKEYLDELEFLAETAGAETVKRFTQKAEGPNITTYVGSGKLQEIREYIEQEAENDHEIGMVIFDDELSARQLRNIEKELKIKILDRTTLILDIFAMRSWLSTDICCQDCIGFGPTLSDRAEALVRAEEKARLGFADLVRHSWKWTDVLFSTVCRC